MPRKRKMRRGQEDVSFRAFTRRFNARFKEEAAYHIEMPTEQDLKDLYDEWQRSGKPLQQWLDEGVIE